MSESVYTAEVLLDSIRILGRCPNDTAAGTADADLLKICDESLKEKIVPRIIRTREEYLVQAAWTPMVSNVTKYRIHPRAYAERLRDICFIDSAGSRFNIGDSPINREELASYGGPGSGVPAGWYLEGNAIQLVPITGSYEGYIEQSFIARPSKLVLSTAVRLIDSVNTVTGVITTTTNLPTTWTTANKFDVYSPYSGAELHALDAVASQVGGGGTEKQVTFTTKIDGSVHGSWPIAIGDYIALAGQAHLIQVPEDLVPLLIEDVVLRIAIGDGDKDKANAHFARVKEQAEEMTGVLDNRVEGRPMKIKGYGAVQGRGF